MAGELLQLQWKFSEMTVRLFAEIKRLGYRWTYGDAYRDPRLHGALGEKKGYGHRESCHKIRLAVDINLFTADGVYLQSDEGHAQLHDFWESIGGARRIPGDANHYSLEYRGRR